MAPLITCMASAYPQKSAAPGTSLTSVALGLSEHFRPYRAIESLQVQACHFVVRLADLSPLLLSFFAVALLVPLRFRR